WRAHDGARAVGFKLARRHPEVVFRDVLADRGVRKIVLGRKNRVKTYVSERVAMHEGRWTHYGLRASELAAVRISVDAESLLRSVELYEHFYARVRRRLSDAAQDFLE